LLDRHLNVDFDCYQESVWASQIRQVLVAGAASANCLVGSRTGAIAP
jgi:hypothetical protein